MIDEWNMAEFAKEIDSNDCFLSPGSHNLLIYDDLKSFESFYADYAAKWLRLNEIVLIATQYQTLDKVRTAIDRRNIDTTKHLDDGSLVIIDAQQGYFTAADMYGTFKLAKSLAKRARKEGRRGLSWLGDMGSFVGFLKMGDMMEYELSCPTKYEDESIRTVCCYHQADFSKLTQPQRDILYKHHFKSMAVV